MSDQERIDAVTEALLPKYPMECGEGWRKIIQPLIEYCQANGFHILQIKEKFGGLRFYADRGPAGFGIDDALSDMIDKAEEECDRTCEVCGAPGALREGGWIKVLCDEHASGRRKMTRPKSAL